MTSARFRQDTPRKGGSVHELTLLGLDLRMVYVRSFNAAHVLYLLYDKHCTTKACLLKSIVRSAGMAEVV
jgi:hypothetical protein